MPRRRATRTEGPHHNVLVASATRYSGNSPKPYPSQNTWQRECYRHYAICGEARFAAKFFGHAVSRAVLYAGQVVNGNPVPTAGAGAAALNDLFDGPDGQTQMLDALGMHLTIAGECYLVGRHVEPEDGPAEDLWEIVSVIEIQVQGNTWTIDYGDGKKPIVLSENDVVIRIWLGSPDRQMIADSPFKSLLPILGEIEWLTRSIFSQITSRLTGAGILLMPQGMSFPPPPGQEGAEVQAANDADAFMLTLADSMLTPIEDPSSPAAQVPIVVTAPDETIDKPRLLQFWTDLDANSLALRNEAIRRFALGMDLPPEQVLGMSSNAGTGGGTSNGVSHWGAWQIEEATIKLHVEPMLDVICNALTVGYLRPLSGDESQVLYDTSALRLRPDRSKEALELYDRGLLSAEAVLRETGFDLTDMPTFDEFTRWLTVKVASGSATPEQVGAALANLGVDLALPPEQIGARPREARPSPSLEEHPSRPRTPAESALVAACEPLVYRALERAGNRMRQAGAKPPGVPSYEVHCWVKANGHAEKIMDDAWATAPMCLEGIADPARVIPVLNSYCKTLIAEQSKHSRSRLVDWLRLAEVRT